MAAVRLILAGPAGQVRASPQTSYLFLLSRGGGRETYAQDRLQIGKDGLLGIPEECGGGRGRGRETKS